MVIGLRILTTGEFQEFNYDDEQIRLEEHVTEKGESSFGKLESPKISGNIYMVFGYTGGSNFNRFDLETVNATGDIIIINTNWLNQPQNIDSYDVIEYYLGESLSDDLIEDELCWQEEGEVRDMDMLDFIDYSD